MASPKYWRNGSHYGCPYLICGAGNSYFVALPLKVGGRKAIEEWAARLGFLKRRYQSPAGTLHWLHHPSSWLRALCSPSCFSGIGTLEYSYPLVLII